MPRYKAYIICSAPTKRSVKSQLPNYAQFFKDKTATIEEIEEIKHWNAILAKNEIARVIRNFKSGDPLPIKWLTDNLKLLEKFIGTSNQPSVKDILTSKYKL